MLIKSVGIVDTVIGVNALKPSVKSTTRLYTQSLNTTVLSTSYTLEKREKLYYTSLQKTSYK